MLAYSVLIALGISLGWLFAIVTRTERPASLAKNLLAGLVGSLGSAALLLGGKACHAPTPTTLAVAILGAGLGLAALHIVRRSFPLPVGKARMTR